ncbi:aspartate/glutamate racemase family protein [Terrarubrum flagellatum]|uniref:aspartate/glutamate racemase family protein n=1 Tax=Terrirubrum flagellatum TaxID=2895980 RepID=UPI003144FE04
MMQNLHWLGAARSASLGAMTGVPRRGLIGVLGGMGPLATVDFMAKVARLTPAERDQDHVPMIVHHVPQIPDRSAAIVANDDGPFLPLAAGLRLLAGAGAEAIVIPCNTAHHWFDRLANLTAVEMIHIADAVADEIARRPRRDIMLLATSGAVAARIYQDRIPPDVADVRAPDAATQEKIDAVIRLVKAGAIDEARIAADAALEHLADSDDDFLLACTELPLALAGSRWQARLIDATDALARACVARSLDAAARLN